MTIDGNLQYQQNLQGRAIAIIALRAVMNTYEVLSPLMPEALSVLVSIQPGELKIITI
jgi:hypothetical protein